MLLLLSTLFGSIELAAQEESRNNNAVSTSSIFDIVNVNQPDAIRNLVGVSMQGENVVITDEESYLKMQGFRTQVFSGNNQRSSKEEAFQKEKEIKKIYPNLPTYVTYTAPLWKLRVGDYRTHEEAYATMRELMKKFPSFGKEMYIVKEEIHIPL